HAGLFHSPAQRCSAAGSRLGQQRTARHARAARGADRAGAGRAAWRAAAHGTRGGLMLRTNLSTRPFYNERAVHALLTVAGLVVLVLTIFNLYEIVVLSREQSELGT